MRRTPWGGLSFRFPANVVTQPADEAQAKDLPLESRARRGVPLPDWAIHLTVVVIGLLPITYLILRGCVSASLWLDEILYYNFERQPAVRALEIGGPVSVWQHVMGTFAYCDLQKIAHTVFGVFGFHLWSYPELYLRLASLVCFALSVIALYFVAVRFCGDRLWSFGVVLAFGSTPLFLSYAFEARVYSLGSLLVIAFLAALAAVLDDSTGWILATGAALGVLIVWVFEWNACLLAAVGILLPVIVWRHPGHWRKGTQVALIIAFGSLLVVLQAAYASSLHIVGQHLIPLLDPQPWRSVLLSTVYGPFLGLLRGDPEYVLGALLVISAFRAPGRLRWCIPAASAIALALSVILMATVGFGVSPRHQTALYAGLFVGLALARPGWIAKALLANLIGLNLVLLPGTAAKILDKANAKQISEAIGSGQRRFPVVVQHSYALGYPDPLHSFALVFYLDVADRTNASTPIYELPNHRDVRDVLADRDYFTDATRRLRFFASSPEVEWAAFLKSFQEKALWFVAPTNSSLGVAQERRYESVLKREGFAKVPGFPREFTGYPPTKLILWKRSGRAVGVAAASSP